MKYYLPIAVGITLSVLAIPAQANVYIGMQSANVNAGVLTTVASGPDAASWSGQYGPIFNAQNISVTTLGGLLDSVALDVLGTAPGDLNVYVTATDAPSANGFLSALTSNILPNGWTLDLSTWIDLANGIYATTTQIGSATFSSVGTETDVSGLTAGNPFSVTGLYQIHSSGHSLDAALSTIHVEAGRETRTVVPEPGTLSLLGAALLALGMMLRSRRHDA